MEASLLTDQTESAWVSLDVASNYLESTSFRLIPAVAFSYRFLLFLSMTQMKEMSSFKVIGAGRGITLQFCRNLPEYNKRKTNLINVIN